MLESTDEYRLISILNFDNFFLNIEKYDEVSKIQYNEVLRRLVPDNRFIYVHAIRIGFHLSLYEFYYEDESGRILYFVSQQIEMDQILGRNDYLRKITYFVNKKLRHVANKD